MNVQITDWNEAATCCWCGKEKECVTIDFDESFFRTSNLCWGCLQNAVRVRSRQPEKSKLKTGESKTA